MNSESVPWHEQFQDVAAASLMRSQKLTQAFTGRFQPTFLTDPSTSHVMSLVMEHHKVYGKTPSKEILFELIRKSYPDQTEKHLEERRTLESKLVKLVDLEVEDDEEYIAKQISQFINWRAVLNEVKASVESIQKGEVDPTMVDRFAKAVRMGEIKVERGITKADIAGVLRKEVNPEHRPRVPTGIVHLDNEIGGGLRGGELAVLLAPPKGFKSGTLMNFAVGGMQKGIGKKVLYITLELSEELQGLRFAIRTTMTEKDQLFKDPERYIKSYEERCDVLYGDNADIDIKYFAPYTCTPKTIRAYLDMMKLDHGIEYGLILVDYLDLMGSDDKKDKDYLEKVQVCTDLRAIAVDYDVPIWTACRATREATGKKRINMSHMAGAFERVAIADLVAALCQTEKERAQGIMRIAFVACRNESGNRQVICEFQPSKMSICSVESRELTDDDFEDEDNGGGGFKKRKKKGDDGDDVEDEAKQRGLKKLKALADNRQKKASVVASLLDEEDA